MATLLAVLAAVLVINGVLVLRATRAILDARDGQRVVTSLTLAIYRGLQAARIIPSRRGDPHAH